MTTRMTTTADHGIPASTRAYRVVSASKLSLEDEFFKGYNPDGDSARALKLWVQIVIEKSVADFGVLDSLVLLSRGRSFNHAKAEAKDVDPVCNTHVGTKYQFIAYVACYIKELVARGMDVEEAWATGCKEICEQFEFRYTHKYLASDETEEAFYMVGSGRPFINVYEPLWNMMYSTVCDQEHVMADPWVVADL